MALLLSSLASMHKSAHGRRGHLLLLAGYTCSMPYCSDPAMAAATAA
jgi:hypothetical protein